MEEVKSKIKGYWEKVKEWVKKVPKQAFVILGVVIIGAAGLTVYLNLSRPYSVLFTGLNNDEATAVMSYLDGQGMKDYRLEDGDTIWVPKSRENTLKAKLLLEGYPKQGFSYDGYYEHVGALSTESERNNAFLLTLQEKMEAVIRCFDGVRDALVTIAPGTDNTYVLDSANKVDATASVYVTMQTGQMLTDKQAQAIRTLVAHGVQGLEIGSVAISDSAGNLYNQELGSDINALDASDLKLYLEEKQGNLIRTRVMQVLVPLFGENNVTVGVHCQVDVNRTIQDLTEVFLPEGSVNGEGTIGSKIWDNYIVRGGDDPAGGYVGAGTNSDMNTYMEEEMDVDGNERELRSSGQIDYDNSRQETHVERVAGYLTDCHVAVSVNSTTAGPMSEETRNALIAHVARAAGITDNLAGEKISIYNAPFYVDPSTVGPIPLPEGFDQFTWLLIWIGAGLVLVLIMVLVLALILGRRKKKKRKQIMVYGNPEDMEAPAGLAEPQAPDVMDMNTEKTMELRKDIRKFADDNPEIAAQMLRNMLRGGAGDG